MCCWWVRTARRLFMPLTAANKTAAVNRATRSLDHMRADNGMLSVRAGEKTK
jgi:hypothetical protein